jgi:hypothetical protein
VTDTGPRQAAPGAQPDDGKRPQAAAIGQPRDRTGRRPQFVVEIWASPQLRDRDPNRALSLSEVLEAGRQPAAGGDREPDPQLEIEP